MYMIHTPHDYAILLLAYSLLFKMFFLLTGEPTFDVIASVLEHFSVL